jgi:diguanylate cyclase (GGDEF)-like protein/PAS domain S-box-containing protein
MKSENLKEIDQLKIVELMKKLDFANQKITLQNEEKQKRADELGIANLELIFQSEEKIKLARELFIANQEIIFQKKFATKLAISNQEFRIAAQIFQSQEGMMVIDANEVILRVNPAFTKITGYSEANAIGQTPRMLSSGKQDKDFYTKMWESINRLGTWEGEIWNRRKNGEIYPQYLTIASVANDEGLISNYVATFTDISREIANAVEIQNLAFYDPLTHLPNRRLLLDRLNQALSVSKRTGNRGALLFLDLDHFKNLNDTLGHSMGDLLLQQVSNRLRNSIRDRDTVARFGGDEFVILLEGLGEDAIECAIRTKEVAEKIILNLNKSYQLKEYSYRSSSSIGASLFNGDELSADELLRQADIAMYQSKSSGRNTIRFFENEMQETITTLVNLERELAKAIDQEKLELYYQVQVNSLGQPLGAEALVRWLQNERGIVLPSQFIPLAEQSGLMLPLGKWVLDAACRQLKRWEDNPLTCHLTLSVNVSVKQFSQVDFADQVKITLQRHAINPALLKLELTESAFIHNLEAIILTMEILKETGLQFELDDFGTGYSSLQYLKRLPIERLKIDQSFVHDIESDDNDKQIVLTIIAMAKNLGLSVIAEGVETEGQRLILKNHDCMNYQGYLFGKPLAIDQFEHALSQF